MKLIHIDTNKCNSGHYFSVSSINNKVTLIMIYMEAIGYLRVSSEGQDHSRQKSNLHDVANKKGWELKRVFAEKISGTIKADTRTAFKDLLAYAQDKNIKLVMVSEISRLGRRVLDVLNTIESLHDKGIGLYVQQFDMCSLEDGKENPTVRLLIQMMSIGAEMENNLRRERQMQGIELARMQGKYNGRSKGAVQSKEKTLTKYQDVTDLLKSSDLSIRRISAITGRSINTVRKVNNLLLP